MMTMTFSLILMMIKELAILYIGWFLPIASRLSLTHAHICPQGGVGRYSGSLYHSVKVGTYSVLCTLNPGGADM